MLKPSAWLYALAVVLILPVWDRLIIGDFVLMKFVELVETVAIIIR